jgi:hypothetical protein
MVKRRSVVIGVGTLAALTVAGGLWRAFQTSQPAPLPSRQPISVRRVDDAVALGTFETREHSLVVIATKGDAGRTFRVTRKETNEVFDDVTEDELRERYPNLYRLVTKGLGDVMDASINHRPRSDETRSQRPLNVEYVGDPARPSERAAAR